MKQGKIYRTVIQVEILSSEPFPKSSTAEDILSDPNTNNTFISKQTVECKNQELVGIIAVNAIRMLGENELALDLHKSGAYDSDVSEQLCKKAKKEFIKGNKDKAIKMLADYYKFDKGSANDMMTDMLNDN